MSIGNEFHLNNIIAIEQVQNLKEIDIFQSKL